MPLKHVSKRGPLARMAQFPWYWLAPVGPPRVPRCLVPSATDWRLRRAADRQPEPSSSAGGQHWRSLRCPYDRRTRKHAAGPYTTAAHRQPQGIYIHDRCTFIDIRHRGLSIYLSIHRTGPSRRPLKVSWWLCPSSWDRQCQARSMW